MSEDLAIIFAYHFPPENTIGAVRPFRFYKYLSRMGYRCHVISAADVSQLRDVDAEYVPDPFFTRPRQGLGWQAERVIRRFFLPGVVGSQWAFQAYRAALRFIEQNNRYRVTVFSTFPPMGTHFAGYWLSRRKTLPWVADFRDPVADNPVYEDTNQFTKNLYRKMEQIFVRSADFTIANTDAAQKKLQLAYPAYADRIHLIWNGFDPEDRLTPLPVASSGPRIVAHVGELYGGRSASPILHSVRRLIDCGRVDPRDFQLLFAGPMVEGSLPDEAFVAAAVREGWLKLDRERVPQKVAHKIIQMADALVLIQHLTVLQVPGKLYEYIQTGRPILAFVPPDSPVERILKKSGVPYQCVYGSGTDVEIDDSVFRFLKMLGQHGKPTEWFETEFNAQSHAKKVGQLIRLANTERHLADSQLSAEKL